MPAFSPHLDKEKAEKEREGEREGERCRHSGTTAERVQGIKPHPCSGGLIIDVSTHKFTLGFWVLGKKKKKERKKIQSGRIYVLFHLYQKNKKTNASG